MRDRSPRTRERLRCNLATVRIVINDKNSFTREVWVIRHIRQSRCCDTRQHSRQREDETAALSPPGTRRLQHAAMQLGDFLRDREAQSESAVLACRRLVGLPKPLENVWQEFRRDA